MSRLLLCPSTLEFLCTQKQLSELGIYLLVQVKRSWRNQVGTWFWRGVQICPQTIESHIGNSNPVLVSDIMSKEAEGINKQIKRRRVSQQGHFCLFDACSSCTYWYEMQKSSAVCLSNTRREEEEKQALRWRDGVGPRAVMKP